MNSRENKEIPLIPSFKGMILSFECQQVVVNLFAISFLAFN
jgi:hypothetical protein